MYEDRGYMYPLREDDEGLYQKYFMKDIERKRLLIKYKEENNSLRTQLKQLNDRLNVVLAKQSSKVGQQQKLPTITNHNNEDILRKELENAHKLLDVSKKQIKQYKYLLKEDLHEQIKALEDKLKQKEEEIENYKKYNKNLLRLHKMPEREIDTDDKALRSKLDDMNAYLARIKKILRDSEKYKQQKEKDDIKKQEYIVSLEEKNRQLQYKLTNNASSVSQAQQNQPRPPEPVSGPSAITHLYMSEDNWKYIKYQFLQLKESKTQMEQKLRAENSILRNRLQILYKSIYILKVRDNRDKAILTERRYQRTKANSTIDVVEADNSPFKMQASQQIEENDKNFKAVPTKLNQSLQAKHLLPQKYPELQTLYTYQWGKQVDRKWNDAKVFKESREARITGVVVWYTDVVIGIRFNYRAHSRAIFTDYHVVTRSKDYHKNQFYFTDNDYLQNMILHYSYGKLTGITFISREGKTFDMGRSIGKPFDLGIKPPNIPVYAFGSLGSILDINKIYKFSVISSLGLQVLIT